MINAENTIFFVKLLQMWKSISSTLAWLTARKDLPWYIRQVRISYKIFLLTVVAISHASEKMGNKPLEVLVVCYRVFVWRSNDATFSQGEQGIFSRVYSTVALIISVVLCMKSAELGLMASPTEQNDSDDEHQYSDDNVQVISSPKLPVFDRLYKLPDYHS